jgi:hypothetical protein
VFSAERNSSSDLDARSALRQFKTHLEASSSPEEEQMNVRVLANMFAVFVEQAQDFLRKKQYLSAAMCYDIASEVRALQPAMRYNAPNALGGGKKNALRCLREAVTAGFNDLARIESDDDLKSIRGSREYRDLVASLRASAKPPKQ